MQSDLYSAGLVLWEILRRTATAAAAAAATEESSPVISPYNNEEEEEEEEVKKPLKQQQQHKSSSSSSLVCDDYQLPYFEFVHADPSEKDMREVVVLKVRHGIIFLLF